MTRPWGLSDEQAPPPDSHLKLVHDGEMCRVRELRLVGAGVSAVHVDDVATVTIPGGVGVHSHAQSEVTNLVTDLAGKVDDADARLSDARTPLAHGHPQSDVTGLVSDLAGKAPSSHGHAQSDVTSLVSDLAGKAATSHGHVVSDTTGLQAALDGKAASAHGHAISDVTSLQTTLDGKAATSHAHVVGDTTGLQTALDAKAAVAHAHAQADVTGLVTDLAAKAALAHSHTQAEVTNLVTDLAGKAAATHSITASHNGFPGTGLTYLRDDGLWVTPPAGGGGGAWTEFQRDLGVGRSSGTFDVTGVSGLTTGAPVHVIQTAAAIASKGNAQDEAEMDQIVVVARALDATSFRAHWRASAVVVGTYALAWR